MTSICGSISAQEGRIITGTYLQTMGTNVAPSGLPCPQYPFLCAMESFGQQCKGDQKCCPAL